MMLSKGPRPKEGAMPGLLLRPGRRARTANLGWIAALAVVLVGLWGVPAAGGPQPAPSVPPSITKTFFGTVDAENPAHPENGQPVDLYTLDNGRGMSITVMTYGGILQAINVPDGKGRTANVALGFNNLDDYVERTPYLGLHHGPVREPDRPGAVHARRCRVPARHQQRRRTTCTVATSGSTSGSGTRPRSTTGRPSAFGSPTPAPTVRRTTRARSRRRSSTS